MNRSNVFTLSAFMLILSIVIVLPAYAQESKPLPEGEIVTPTALSKNPVLNEIPLLIKQLLNDDPEIADEARTELLEIGPPAVLLLIEALQNDKPAMRYMVCEILAELRDTRTLPPLLNLLKDKTEYTASIASAAVRVLGRLGNPSVIRPLIETASSPDVDLRYESIRALGILRAQEAITLTMHALTDTAETFLGYQVRCVAIQALGRLKTKEAVPRLINLLDIKTTEPGTELAVAQYAIKALEKVTGHSEGSFLWRDEKQRDEIIWRWKDWWGKHKVEYGIEETPPEKLPPSEKKPEETKPAEEKTATPEKETPKETLPTDE